MSSIFKALPTSMCPPPLWVHRQRRIVWQSNMSGHSQLVMSLETKPGQVYFCTCRIFSPHYISFLLVVRAVAPFVSQAKRPPWQGVWAAATINTVGMRSLEWRRPLLHAPPRPPRPCLPSQRVYIALALHSLSCAVRTVRCAVRFSTLTAIKSYQERHILIACIIYWIK